MYGAESAGERTRRPTTSFVRHTPPLESWWLNTVGPGSWGEVVIEQQGELVARLPYVRKRKLGLTVSSRRPLTGCIRHWLRPSSGEVDARLGVECDLMGELIEKLPAHDPTGGSSRPP